MMSSLSVSPQVFHSHEFDSAGETEDSWQYLDSQYASGCSNPSSLYFLNSPGGSLQSFIHVPSRRPSASAPGSGAGSPMASRLSPPYHAHPPPSTGSFRDQAETPPISYSLHPGDGAAAYAFPTDTATAPSMPMSTTAAAVTMNGDVGMTMALDYMPVMSADQMATFLHSGFFSPLPQQQQFDMASFPVPIHPYPIAADLSYQASQQSSIQQPQAQQHIQQPDSSPSTQDLTFDFDQGFHPEDQPLRPAWTSSESQLQTQETPMAKAPNAPTTRRFVIHESPYSKDPSLPRPSPSSSAPSVVARRDHNHPNAASSRKAKPMGVQKSKKDVDKTSFFVFTAEQVNIATAAGRSNCFDGGMHTTQRGRKGPLATSTKEAALKVRIKGACFCCKSRKVRCDADGDCRNCRKIRTGTPQLVCWRFPEFIPVLFPEFMRTHLRRDEMAEFIREHVGMPSRSSESYQIELHSGDHFQTTLVLKALTFQPKDVDAHHGWHSEVKKNEVQLHKQDSVPLLLDLETDSQREAVKRKISTYISSLSTEEHYAKQITEELGDIVLPKKILDLVQNYARKTDSKMVKKALSICTAHYVLMHQLLFRNKDALRCSTLSMPEGKHPTAVVLNRQLKALIDEQLAREVSDLFRIFNTSLKPRSKLEWTPCLAAFLVVCLFMEDMERATDMFVLSKNEISIRAGKQRLYTRKQVLEVNEQVEKMPFQQFMWQFHHIYQTHSKEHGSKAFNPLLDDASLATAATDGGVAAAELIGGLRGLVGPDWKELHDLVKDPILPMSETEEHPWPRNLAVNYCGRLAARFLMSFKSEEYIFGVMPKQGCVPLPSAAVREWVNSQQRDMMDLSAA
ncbi:hypothetical protein VDGD_06668 [Verticillium dahliae]|nr:hypothetical protein VDGD_06668 [Verticillium dahliae]